MKERGMKKWLAYKSLTSQEDFLKAMKQQKSFIEKPLISESKAPEIDYLLRADGGERVSVLFYLSGRMRSSDGTISRIDGLYKFLEINGLKIWFKDIVEIERI